VFKLKITNQEIQVLNVLIKTENNYIILNKDRAPCGGIGEIISYTTENQKINLCKLGIFLLKNNICNIHFIPEFDNI